MVEGLGYGIFSAADPHWASLVSDRAGARQLQYRNAIHATEHSHRIRIVAEFEVLGATVLVTSEIGVVYLLSLRNNCLTLRPGYALKVRSNWGRQPRLRIMLIVSRTRQRKRCGNLRADLHAPTFPSLRRQAACSRNRKTAMPAQSLLCAASGSTSAGSYDLSETVCEPPDVLGRAG